MRPHAPFGAGPHLLIGQLAHRLALAGVAEGADLCDGLGRALVVAVAAAAAAPAAAPAKAAPAAAAAAVTAAPATHRGAHCVGCALCAGGVGPAEGPLGERVSRALSECLQE